jgi:hypothetical protein
MIRHQLCRPMHNERCMNIIHRTRQRFKTKKKTEKASLIRLEETLISKLFNELQSLHRLFMNFAILELYQLSVHLTEVCFQNQNTYPFEQSLLLGLFRNGMQKPTMLPPAMAISNKVLAWHISEV